MGLFTQSITLGLTDKDYVIEKQEIKLKKTDIDLYVKNGSIAFIDGMKYEGNPKAYQLDANMLGGNKKDIISCYVCPDRMFNSIIVKFFAGQHTCALSYLPAAKLKFAVVGSIEVMITDYNLLVKAFERSLTKEDLEIEINSKYKKMLGDEIAEAIKKLITPDTTESELHARLGQAAKDVFKGSRRTLSALSKLGLVLQPNSITMHVNTVGETDETITKVMDIINKYAIEDLEGQRDEKEYAKQQAELDKALQHELDLAKINRSEFQEKVVDTTITKNNNGTDTVINNFYGAEKFCPKCGAKMPSTAAFCSVCGTKL